MSTMNSTKRKYTEADFTDEVRAMSNQELVDKAGQAILGAAIMARFSRLNTGKDDALADAIYAEADRRGNPDLYRRGFNSAVLSQGHETMVSEVTLPIEYREDV